MKTVYKSIYPSETTDMTPIVSKIAAANPDAVIGGTQAGDGYSLVKAMVQAKFSPKFLFLSNGPNSPGEFPSKVGAEERQRDLQPRATGSRRRRHPGNPAFVKAFLKRTAARRTPSTRARPRRTPSARSSRRVAKKLHSIDNKKIIAALHKGTWPTVEGDAALERDRGAAGQLLLVEWIGGKLYPVVSDKRRA